MIFRLMYFELVMLFRKKVIVLPLVCFALLILVTALNLATQTIESNQQKNEISVMERQRWLNQGEKDPHSAAHYSVFAFKPTSLLAMLDYGVEPFVGQTVWLEAHAQNNMLYRPQGEASVLQRAGLANPTLLIIFFGPLFACLLVFSAIAQAKESGVLRFELSASTNPTSFILTKLFSIVILLITLLNLPSMIFAIVTLIMRSQISLDSILRVGLWLMVVSVYLLVVTMVSMSVSLRVKNTRSALIGFITLWVVFVLALPRWISASIDLANPLPTTQEIEAEIAREAPSYWTAEEGVQRREAILKEHGVDSEKDLAIDLRGAQLDYAERKSHKVYDRVLGNLHRQVQRQDQSFSWFSFVSPAISLSSLSPAISGTDFSQHLNFIQTAESYRRDLVNRMNQEVMEHPGEHKDGESLWSQIPSFSYPPLSLSDSLANSYTALWSLLVWLMIGVYLMAMAIRRIKL